MTKIYIINEKNKHFYKDILEQSFRTRYEIFVGERGWKALERPDGRDIDEYDRPETTYLLAVDQGKVVGGQRLFPTTRPHMLSEVFPHLAAVKGVPVSTDTFEWTRYFVVKERRSGRTDCRLLAAVQEYALGMGISQLTAVIETWWLPRFQEAKFKVHPLGLPALVEGAWSVAVRIDVSVETLSHVKKFAGIKGSVLHGEGMPFESVPVLGMKALTDEDNT
jgi:acyl-homoserine lactone synthase